MSVGFIMLVHEALERAEQVARHWATRDCPVVIHVDKRVKRPEYNAFAESHSGACFHVVRPHLANRLIFAGCVNAGHKVPRQRVQLCVQPSGISR